MWMECDLVHDVFVDGLIFNLADLKFARTNNFFSCLKFPLMVRNKWHLWMKYERGISFGDFLYAMIDSLTKSNLKHIPFSYGP